MKYKVGDKVRIRKDLIVGCDYHMEGSTGTDSVVENMLQFCGMVATVKGVNKSGGHAGGYYDIDIDRARYYWTDEMFEGLAEEACSVPEEGSIPYINAKDARMMFDADHVINNLRRLAYGAIRDSAKTKNNVTVDVIEFPLEIRELMSKELVFKGFSVHLDNPSKLMIIRW